MNPNPIATLAVSDSHHAVCHSRLLHAAIWPDAVCKTHCGAARASGALSPLHRFIQLSLLTLALALQWTQKLALAAFLQPLVSVFLSTRCGQQHIFNPLRRCFRMSEVATLDMDTQWAMVFSRLELMMCIGPLVPLLLPLGPSPHVCCRVINCV